MDELTFTDEPQEARFYAIKELLHRGQCLVDFTKVDGTDRTMLCTLMEELMEAPGRVLSDDVTDVPTNAGVITVWSLESSAWRAMRTMNVKRIKLIPSSWTVEVEEDPKTGELLLQLPEDMLKINGWVEGTELEWVDQGDGSWTLKKI